MPSSTSHIPSPLVVIFGRTNVGKSTLFNTIAEKRQALVSDTPGTTRDSNVATVEWRYRRFSLVDTGGFMNLDFLSRKKITATTIDERVQKQARDLIRRADVVLFTVDTKDGLLPQDKAMAAILKRITPRHDHIIVVANKTDTQRARNAASEFFNLGLGDVQPVSAATGAGTGDLLDLVVERLPDEVATEPEQAAEEEFEEESDDEAEKALEESNAETAIIKVCLLGKPNVGKSSLLNAILGYERVIVSPTPHTTREPQSTVFQFKNRSIEFVDTAGISRHGHKAETLEKFSMDKSLAMLEKADLALLVLDMTEPITKQDARLVEEIFDRRKSLIIIANKWDAVEKRDTKKYTNYVYGELPFATYAPLQFISAKNRSKIDHLLDLILTISRERHIRLSDSQTERLMKDAVKKHRPTKGRGTKYPRVYEFKQTHVNPPRFMVRVGARESLAETYLRFLENQLRARFGFIGTPISIWVKKGRDTHGAHDS